MEFKVENGSFHHDLLKEEKPPLLKHLQKMNKNLENGSRHYDLLKEETLPLLKHLRKMNGNLMEMKVENGTSHHDLLKEEKLSLCKHLQKNGNLKEIKVENGSSHHDLLQEEKLPPPKQLQQKNTHIIGEDASSHHDLLKEEKLPLLKDSAVPNTDEKTLIQKAISQTFRSTAHLANLLPTGTVLAFQLLSPIFSNSGNCDPVSRSMTAGLVFLCGLSCFLSSFTDTVRDSNGNVFYGFATFRGIWIIDGSTAISPELAAKYRVQFIDFVHALMSILVFAAVTLFDQNVVACFFPTPSTETKEVLTSLPVGIGVICSMLFVVFPTQRHGIGFPLSAN